MASTRNPGKVCKSGRGAQCTFTRSGAARHLKGRRHPKDDARHGPESDTLLALYSLGAASGSDDKGLRTAIRAYVRAVVDDEWPRLAIQERSAKADAALNALLREVAQPATSKDAVIQRTMLDMVLRATRCSRFTVSVPQAGPTIKACAPRFAPMSAPWSTMNGLDSQSRKGLQKRTRRSMHFYEKWRSPPPQRTPSSKGRCSTWS